MDILIKKFYSSTVLLVFIFILTGTKVQAGVLDIVFDKSSFYSALASGRIEEIDSVSRELKKVEMAEKPAYEGALLMRKAGLLRNSKEKLKLFKAGRAKLEAAISRSPENTEYHFLRLIIQENAPEIVNYKAERSTDAALVRSRYKTLPADVQRAVLDYSKKSAFLKATDF